MAGLSFNKWLYSNEIRPHAEQRLFCFPYAGGNAQMFRSWSKWLPESFEVVAVNLPGHGSRIMEPAITRLGPLILRIAEAIYPYLLEKPFAFFGHSMGALVSFELTRHLVKNCGVGPKHIFVSAYRAPQLSGREKAAKNYTLPDNELKLKIRDLNGTPDWVLQNDELMQLAVPIMRADMEVCETYEYIKDHPVNIPITAIIGKLDKNVDIAEVKNWGKQTTGSFNMKIVEGDHFYINNMDQLTFSTILEELLQ